MASVRRRGKAVVAVLDAEEAQLLRLLADDLQSLLGEAPGTDGAEPDLMRQLTGLRETAPDPPTDPALARLLPDGYADDPEAAAELRRLTEGDLRETKSEAARTLVDTLPEDGGRIRLGADDAGAWLCALNDLRLVLGTRLDVSEESGPLGGHRPDDPAAAPYVVYDWLTGLQDAMVAAIMR